MRPSVRTALACAALLAGFESRAIAAEPGATVVRPEEGAPAPASKIEEITVTARKISESAQTVPIAITAFNADTIESLNTRDIADFSVLAPALAIARTDVTPGGAIIYMRGVGNSDIEKTQDPGVVVNLDGVDIASMVGSTLDTFDLEHVEVLRGPQGTLFGRNTIGGSIVVRHARPSGDWGTKGQVTLGSFHRNDYQLTLDTPSVGEQLAFKFGVMSRNDNGPYRKLHTDPIPGVSLGSSGGRGPELDRQSFLTSALWTPMDGMDWLLTYERARDRGDSPLFLSLAGPTEVPCSVYGVCNYPDPDTDHIANDYNRGMRLDVDATTLEGNWDVGWFTLTSVTGWRDTTENLTFDVDASQAFVYHTDRPAWYKQFSQELRAAGSLVDDRLRYVAGLYYFWGQYDSHAQIQSPILGAIGPNTALQRGKQTDVAPAAFANVDVQLIDTVKLSLGGRYTSEWKEFTGCAGTRAGGYTICNGRITGNIESASDSHTWRKFTPKIGLDWQPNDDLLFWVSWSTGFRSGGYNGRNYGLTSIGPYDPEVLASWDAGMKSYWLDRRVRFNVGLFDNDYRNKMETVITADPVLGTQTQIVNAASAKLQGFELELSTVPFEGLELGGSWAQLDARYLSFFADLDGDGIATDNSDRPVSQAPRYQIAAWFAYTLPWAVGPGRLTLGSQYRFRDASKSAVTEDPRGDTPSFPILDASARYDFDLRHGTYHATFFYRNLFDEVHALGGVTVTPLFSFAAVNPGRTWGLELGFDF